MQLLGGLGSSVTQFVERVKEMQVLDGVNIRSYELISCLTNQFNVLRVNFLSYELI